MNAFFGLIRIAGLIVGICCIVGMIAMGIGIVSNIGVGTSLDDLCASWVVMAVLTGVGIALSGAAVIGNESVEDLQPRPQLPEPEFHPVLRPKQDVWTVTQRPEHNWLISNIITSGDFEVVHAEIDGRSLQISKNLETGRFNVIVDHSMYLDTDGSRRSTIRAIKNEFGISPKELL